MPVLRIIALLCTCTSMLMYGNALHAQKPASRENQLKAVFLFNFTQFVEWPPTSFSSGQAPMVIGILGTDLFGSYLDEIVADEKINGHPLLIRRYNNMEEVDGCHILYVNIAESKKREQVITKLGGRNILTVSDAPDFLLQGGMIRFFTKQDKIKLQVNLEASKAANLVISSKLLRLVEIFTP